MEMKDEYITMTDNKKDAILQVSIKLFLEQGYYKTSMRQIATEAEVSLGLVEYHFGNKRTLAFTYLQNLLMQIPAYYINETYDLRYDPVLRSCVIMRTYNQILSSPNYRNFYRDMLDADILLDAILESGTETIDAIIKLCGSDMNVADALFYGNCLGPSVERALMHFSMTDELSMDMPDIIFKAYIQFLVKDTVYIDNICKKAKMIVDDVIKKNPQLLELKYNAQRANFVPTSITENKNL